ncbi:hypothetical protein [Aquisalibacillus elongatus]|uniref:Uncharacterized protein n=1 Tax=Aquisalibacillus elongatus TaxID=485577 RepID=A0A3N5B683_9BACI|nr:hypothetical protein [Aquisalibacillus elongatus]RPF53196.1 hypothetical protein EDC24_1692 [Aquisalibacillus elongatus]
MSKEFVNSKREYVEDISFTEVDREQVLEKIQESKQSVPTKKGIFHPIPVALTLITSLIIAVLFLTNIENLVTPSTGTESDLEKTEGYIVKIEENEAIITNSETQQNISYTNIPEEFKLGQMVTGWHEKVNDRANVELQDYEIKQGETIDGSDLTDEEAIRTALKAEEFKRADHPIIESVQYHSDSRVWSIQVSTNDQDSLVIDVDDQTNEVITNQNNETDETPNFDDILTQYEQTLKSLKNNETQYIDFNNEEELKNYLTQAMSESLAEIHIETYIDEREGGLYLIETEFPTFIDTEKDYQTEQQDAETYYVKQQVDTELMEHPHVTVVIKKRQDQWIVADTE